MHRWDPLSGQARNFRVFPAALLSLLTALSLPGEAGAQTPVERVFQFLDGASGFLLLGEVREATLQPGDSLTLGATLLEGSDYMVVGYCEQACTNIDLVLIGESGQEVQADRLPDAEPILTLRVEETGFFRVRVQAEGCGPGGCRVAVGFLGSTDDPGVIPGEDMGGRLVLLATEFKSLGFTKVGEEGRGALDLEGSSRIPLNLRGGTEYIVAGVCDADCFDLDLALRHPDGHEVTRHFSEDELPILSFVPDTTAEYSLEVIMSWCEIEPCAFRVITYGREEKPQGGAVAMSGDLLVHQKHEGALEKSDELLGDTYLDVYEVEAEAGQRIVADLRSDEFDALLRIIGPDGVGMENDEYAAGLGLPHIEILGTETGTYVIQVTSYQPLTKGKYALEIAVKGARW